MDLQQLRYFVAVDDDGSFAKAAEKLNVAQSAVSTRIKRLEDTLGVDLFVRSPTGSSLTPAGILLVGHARAILDRVAQATAEVKYERSSPDVVVQLGLSGAGRILTIPILKAVQADLKGVTVRVVEALSGHLEKQLSDRQLDLSLLFRPADRRRISSSSAEPFYLVSAKRSRRRYTQSESLTLEELSGIGLTMPTARHQVRRFLVEAAQRKRLSLNIAREIDSNARIMDLVLYENASSVMLLPAFMSEWQAGKLNARRVSNVYLERIVVVAPCRHKHRAEKIEAVRHLVLSVAESIARKSTALIQHGC